MMMRMTSQEIDNPWSKVNGQARPEKPDKFTVSLWFEVAVVLVIDGIGGGGDLVVRYDGVANPVVVLQSN